ncbi:MAG: DUF2784 family protein [Minisyncoccia bacterium]
MQPLTNIKKTLYLAIASILFTVHFLLFFLVAVGWLIPSLFYFFLGALIATFLSEIFLGYCPLSKWEFDLRRRLDPSREFDKSCIVHYIRMTFGLKPRVHNQAKKTFIKEKSFLLVLIALFIVSILYRFMFL